MKIEYIEVDKLIPYINNPKQHSEDQVNLIASSIKEFGFINPVIIDKNNEVIAGHGRLLASKKLGLDKVPVIRAEHLTPAQVKAYRIADNRLTELGSWDNELLKVELEELKELDFDIELTGFDFDDFEFENDEKEFNQLEDNIKNSTIPDKAFSKYGDLWLIGEHRLLCGDSTKKEDLKKLFGDKKIDMLFTDPPYAVDYASKNDFLNAYDKGNRIQREIKNDNLSLEEFEKFLTDVFNNIRDYFNEYSSYYITSAQGGGVVIYLP